MPTQGSTAVRTKRIRPDQRYQLAEPFEAHKEGPCSVCFAPHKLRIETFSHSFGGVSTSLLPWCKHLISQDQVLATSVILCLFWPGATADYMRSDGLTTHMHRSRQHIYAASIKLSQIKSVRHALAPALLSDCITSKRSLCSSRLLILT